MYTNKTYIKRLCAAALLFVAFSGYINANAQKFSENEVKAAFIYKLSKFIRWDGESNKTFCTIGSEKSNSNEIGDSYQKISKSVVRNNIDLGEVDICKILFIDESKSNNLKNILAQTAKKQIVTISDIKSFTRKGGMFGFISDTEGRIKLELNLHNSKESNIDISSRLLEMIKVVEK